MKSPPPLEFLNRLSSSPESALGWVCDQVDDRMLREIAEADYGTHAFEHLQALEKLRSTRKAPSLLPRMPRDVLEIMSGSHPDDPEWLPGVGGERGHIIRAFSAVMLLAAGANDPNRAALPPEQETIIALVESSLAFDDGFRRACLDLLFYRLHEARSPESVGLRGEDELFFLLGAMLLTLSLEESKRPIRVEELCEALVTTIERLRRPEEGGDPKVGWIIEFGGNSEESLHWQDQARRFLLADRSTTPTSGLLTFIGELLCGGRPSTGPPEEEQENLVH